MLTHFGRSIADDSALGVSISILFCKTLPQGLACGTKLLDPGDACVQLSGAGCCSLVLDMAR